MNFLIGLQMAPPATQGWKAELAQRMRHLLLLKTAGITAWTWLFFVGYFHLLRNPAYPVLQMPLTALDTAIPLQPAAIVAYLTLWIYVGIAPGLQSSFVDLVVYGLWSGALCITGLAIFYFWPTEVPPLTTDVSGFPGFATLQGADAGGNACPSMHVAIAIFSVLRIEERLRRVRAPNWLRLANLLWFLAIAYSTLAIKQHVVLDVIAGALLGLAFALPSLRWRPARRARAGAALAADTIEP